MSIQSAHRAAYQRQLGAAGEMILLDGKPTMALIGNEESLPELGADGEPLPTVTLVLSVAADKTSPEILSQGVPIQVRGQNYGLEGYRNPSSAYYELTCLRR